MVFVAVAFAESVAVLDFVGPGGPAMAEAVRSELLREGSLQVWSAADIAGTVAAPFESQLREGREAVLAARRAWSAGDCSGTLGEAERAVVHLTAAGARVGLRTELADAYYFAGLCQAGEDASQSFAWVRGLDADYAARQGRPETYDALPAARWSLAEDVAQVHRALDADRVVTGAVTTEGVVLRVWLADGEVSAAGDDPADLAKRIVGATLQPVGTKLQMTRRWWFWTGAAVILGGVGVTVYAVTEPAPNEVPGDPTWSVSVR